MDPYTRILLREEVGGVAYLKKADLLSTINHSLGSLCGLSCEALGNYKVLGIVV